MARKSVNTEMANLTKRQNAITTLIGNKPVTLEGKQYTGAALAERCARAIAADEQVEETNRAWRKAVADRDLRRQQDAPVFAALKGYVQATFGKSSQTVAEFGYKPAGAIVKSVESKAAAVGKLRATRTARHTMGSKQRRSIKGTAPSSPTPVPSGRTAS